MFRLQWREVERNAIWNKQQLRLCRSQVWNRAQKDWTGFTVRHVDRRKGKAMAWVFKALIFLVIIGFAGLTAYAYLGDLAPVQSEVKQPVVLNAD